MATTVHYKHFGHYITINVLLYQVEVTEAIMEYRCDASRKAVEDDKKASHKTQSNTNSSLHHGPPSEQGQYPPRRHDSYSARSDSRRFDSDASPAFSPRGTLGISSPHDMGTGEDISGASTRFGFDAKEVTAVRRDYCLFPDEEQNDSLQQSTPIMRPPRTDSIQSFAKDSRSYHPSGGVDSRRGTSVVPTRQVRGGVEDQRQRNPESQYGFPSQQRADPEARHKPELAQQRQPAVVSQSPQASYERERHAKPDRHSEIEPQQHKPRQPSPDTHGQQRSGQQNLDPYEQQRLPKRNSDAPGQPRPGERKYYK